MLITHFLMRLSRYRIVSRLFTQCRSFSSNEQGASIVIIALILPVFIGAVGLAVEVSDWQMSRHDMQNAADAAAIAAAGNAGSDYAAEGMAVAAEYGFPNGKGQIAVKVTHPSTAPNCTANCYVATISDDVPLFLSQVVGYRGSTTAGTQRATTISATAVATSTSAYKYCIFALAGSGAEGIVSHGAPKADLNGCNTMSNTGSTCTGHNLNAAVGDAAGTNSGCGNVEHSGVEAKTDSFARLATNIPENECSSFPRENPKKGGPNSLPSANQLSGFDPYGSYQTSDSSGSYQIFCGDVALTGDTTVNNTVLVIENGLLDTGGHTLSGSGLTIVFTGANSPGYDHYPVDTAHGGTLDITAPTSGMWSGVAIYQDPALTENVDISAAGNSPTWNITGLVYLPHASVTLSGAVNKSSTGLTCFELVVDNLTINGTGDIFANDSQCAAAGLSQTSGGSRGTLVY